MKQWPKYFTCGLAVAFGFSACGGDETVTQSGTTAATGGETVIGVLYNDIGTEQAPLLGLRMAADDLNATGLYTQKFRIVNLDFTSGANDNRIELAEKLIKEYKAVGIISEWSSTAKKVLNLTNKTYQDVIQCSGSSTNTKINDPNNNAEDADGVMGADANDTLYRAVSNDKKQALLAWGLVPTADQEKLAVVYGDDGYGASFVDEIKKHAAAAGITSVQYLPVNPGDDMKATEDLSKTAISTIVKGSNDGSITNVFAIGLPHHGAVLMKQLSKCEVDVCGDDAGKSFKGNLIVPDGMIGEGFFANLGDDFATWIDTPGNSIKGTNPDNYSGANSAAWFARLTTKHPNVDVQDAFTPSHADCLYSFGLAMLHEPEATRYTGAALKKHMANQKEGALGSSYEKVAPTTDSFKDLPAKITAGTKLALDGASGLMVYDKNGDRRDQPYSTKKVVKMGSSYEWKCDKVYQPNLETSSADELGPCTY
ncbi:MAG: ABC transporter substrate-binding protein [Myxococcota bacterium]|nr:ABC transporter substrate-binding protein [Myxococcota bacterium]